MIQSPVLRWLYRQFVVGECIGGGPAFLKAIDRRRLGLPEPPSVTQAMPDRDDFLFPGDVKRIRARLARLERKSLLRKRP